MNFPRFWAKGQAKAEKRPIDSWGWSDVSMEDAKQRGDENARRAAERLVRGSFKDHRRYYGDRPFREEVLQTIHGPTGAASAHVTRNSYGCLVLNTSGLMFIDVDLEGDANNSDRRGGGWLAGIFGRSQTAAPPKDANIVLSRAKDWAAQNPGWGWRVYRTRAGLRFAATHELFEPQSMADSPLFDHLTADPLYRRLCKNQKCFRARLTPKPWRCGVSGLSVSWPWSSPRAEKRFQDWEKRYLKACAPFSTCDLIATVGSSNLHPATANLIQLHDQQTRVGSKLPLA